MTLLLANRALDKIEEDKILVTMTPTNGYTVGFNFTFSDALFIDFKDGDGKELLTSGIEKTHTYSSAGTYIAEITGNLSSITKFIADNNRITVISGLKTGLLIDLRLFSNLLTNLDLSNAPISSLVYLYSNPNLTSITFASSGNSYVNDFRAYNCNITGTLNLSNVPLGITSRPTFHVYSNPNLTNITFASVNNIIWDFKVYSCNITGTFDLSNVPIGGTDSAFWIQANANLTGITFASSGNGILSDFRFNSCNITGILDLSNVAIGGTAISTIIGNSNANMTGITFASSGNAIINSFQLHSCDITGTIDFSNVPIRNTLHLYSNSNLTGITFASSGNGTIFDMLIYSCNIDYVDFTPPSFSLDLEDAGINIANNGISAGDINHFLVDFDSISSGGYTGRLLTMDGTNSAPDGSSGGYDGLTAKANLQAKGFTVTTN